MEAEDEKLIWKEMDARAGFYVNVTNHKKLKNFLPHTVKFGKIQTWISDLTSCSEPNIFARCLAMGFSATFYQRIPPRP